VAWSPSLSGFSNWCLGIGCATIVFLILARIGVGCWAAWDLSERREARFRFLHPVSRVRPLLTLLAIGALTVGVSLGTVVWLWR
jgi:hypothetical protein